MHILKKQATICTPEVVLNPQNRTFKLEGESFPENVFAFYEDIIEWLEEYIASEQADLTVIFKVSFFNSSSNKILSNLLDLLNDFVINGGKIFFKWYYHDEDLDKLEDIEDMISDLNLEVETIPYTT